MFVLGKVCHVLCWLIRMNEQQETDGNTRQRTESPDIDHRTNARQYEEIVSVKKQKKGLTYLQDFCLRSILFLKYERMNESSQKLIECCAGFRPVIVVVGYHS